jgi:methyltransferase (TIGR00027 family)
MRSGVPSGTAISVAALRAAHLHLFEGPKIHEDNFALRLIGAESAERLRANLEQRGIPALRRVSAYFALRQRFSEERLDAALLRGVTQVVLLGAGLDTFALRRPRVPKEILFVEVDHPASQRWKLDRLAALGLETPGVKYVPVDFASHDLGTELASAGVKLGLPTLFAWLGVTPYIPALASWETFSFVARHGIGSEVVFDVVRSVDGLAADERAISDRLRVTSAERGEPWLSFFEPEQLATELAALGFTSVSQLTPEVAARYYVGQPSDVTPLTAWVLMSACV